MRVRHRIPSIFSLSMVDVLCCALGCVILLWLLNLREAKEHEDGAAEQLAKASRERDRTRDLLAAARAERGEVYRLITDMEDEQSALRRRLASQEESARDLAARLDASARRAAGLERDLKGAQTTAALVPGLRARLKTAQDHSAEEEGKRRVLEAELAQRLDELRETGKTLAGRDRDLAEARSYRDRWEAAQARVLALERELAQRLNELRETGKVLAGRDRDLAEARSYRDRWEAARARVLALERELAQANRNLGSAERENKTLRSQADRVRSAADNRFAGIAPTGRRVVFLVDMSGSMKLLDLDTPAPGKWQEVRQTVVRLMRSLPDLEKFQVIVFAERARYLLGGPGRWLDYDARTSPGQVLRALAALEPDGGTNVYAAMEAAFALRDQELDTIYLLSDGLPDRGEGLAAERAATLQDVAVLTQYIRRKLKTEWNRPRAEAPARVRINTIGFFYESPDVGAFLWALARENDGGFVGMSKP
jgi:hypothetical protein